MTLSIRNNCFKAGITLSSLSFAAVAAVVFVVMPAYPAAADEAVRRSAGMFRGFLEHLAPPAPYAPFASMMGAVLYSLVSIILIYFLFEKTQSQEILFFSFFVLSLTVESFRIIIPLKIVYGFSAVYCVMAARVLVFSRYFGLFSLFASSICAAGLEVQKQRNTVMVAALTALVIAMGIPVDGLSWDSSLIMLTGYTKMFTIVEGSLLFFAVISFFIAAYNRGSRDYIFIGIGTLLVFIGRNILLNADAWLAPLPGLIILATGTWFFCTRLHQIYLWL
ncbi:MAG: hypothetical protein LBQ67_04290 [Treponema sp.]|jgi:hypothetical protein|nr:hypothetical protein [Treponema sp.]